MIKINKNNTKYKACFHHVVLFRIETSNIFGMELAAGIVTRIVDSMVTIPYNNLDNRH